MIDISTLKNQTADMTDSYIIVSGVDRLFSDHWPLRHWKEEDLDISKLFEIRIFNKEKEIKWFRPDIAGDFRMRVMDDSVETFDEWQYLDIDTKAGIEQDGDGSWMQSTTAGRYYLPIKTITENTAIKIRCVISYYASGKAYVSDFRCVEFGERK